MAPNPYPVPGTQSGSNAKFPAASSGITNRNMAGAPAPLQPRRPGKVAQASALRCSLLRIRASLNTIKVDAKNIAKPSVTKSNSSTPAILKRADARKPGLQEGRDAPTRSTIEKTQAARQPAKLSATSLTLQPTSPAPKAPKPSAQSNGLWFEDVGQTDRNYSALYALLDQERFRGYGCLEGKLIGNEFLVPNESIQRIEDQLEKRSSRMPFVSIQERGQQHSIPFVGPRFKEHRKGLTVGIAIQQIYMSILWRENALQSITPFAQDPARGWTLYIGDLMDSLNIPLLQERDIGFVVSVHPKDFRSKGQDERLAKAGIKHHSCQLDDSKSADMLSKLGGLIERINNHISNSTPRKSVLVHCVAGLSRSVTVVLGWTQREYYLRDVKNSPISPEKKFELLVQHRTRKFEELKRKRPGVKCDNFKTQLERYAAQMVGYSIPAPAPAAAPKPPPIRKADEEHGGGGYLKEAVVWFYYIYHLEPSPTVLNFGYERIAKLVASNHGGSRTLQAHLKPWCDACAAKLQTGPVQKGNI